MRVGFHPEARIDLAQAAARYAEVSVDLAQEFYAHVDRLLDEIAERPLSFRVFRAPQTRRHFGRTFPYAVVYVVKQDEIYVLAVMHFKRASDYWTRRI